MQWNVMREPNGRKVPIGNGNSKSLVEEIDAAVVEVESIKTALKCGEGKMEMSYLGLVGGSDRRSLLQLLQSGMQQLDRLREKEIELLKSRSNDLADTNAGDNCLARQCCRQPTDWSGDARGTSISNVLSRAEDTGRVGRSLEDITTWVSCRSLLDELKLGNVCIVDSPIPRVELSASSSSVHRFQWPKADPAAPRSADGGVVVGRYRPRDDRERAGLSTYLNAALCPGRGSEWVIPSPGAVHGSSGSGSEDFLSLSTEDARQAGSGRGTAADAVPGTPCGVIHGDAPSAAVCLSEAVKNGMPSAGLRVLMEIVRPGPIRANGTFVPGGGGVSRRGGGGGGGAEGEGALYRAIATLVAANARSPSCRPVVVLTDLQGVWKLLWLGESRRATAAASDCGAAGTTQAAGGTPEERNVSRVGMTGPKDVFVWRMTPAGAASVLRSMMLEETAAWDGEISWQPRGLAGHGWSDAYHGNGAGAHREFGPAGEDDSPMAVLRNRHLVGRGRIICRGRASSSGGSSGDGAGGLNATGQAFMDTASPPLAMEMALRRSSATFTGQSLQSLPAQGNAAPDLMERCGRSLSMNGGPEHLGEGFGAMRGAAGAGGGEGGPPPFPHRRAASMFMNLNGHHVNGYANGSVAHDGRVNNHAHTPPSNGRSNGFVDVSGINYTNGVRESVAAAGGTQQTRPTVMDPLAGGSDTTILKCVISFAFGDGFLFVAGVSKSWRDAWGVERPPETTIDAAVQSSSRLTWARSSGCHLSETICARAAAGGHLSTLRYARAIGCPWDWRTCANAATEHLVPVSAMIEWAANRPSPSGSDFQPRPKPPAFRMKMLQWARTNGCPWDESTISEAAREGNMDILRYARANGCPWNVLTCAYAAAAGHLDVLEWAREDEGCPWNEATCAFAAAGGHLEVLKWVRARGCPWGEETCASAARAGRLEVLKWARQNGCPWGGGTSANAAEGGHLEVLQWVRGEGCPWTEATCTLAARQGQLEVLKWARRNGCAWTASTFRAAAGKGNREILQFLYDEGCPWDRRTCACAAKSADLETLMWLRSNGCPWDSRTLDYAAEVGAMDVFEWASSNGCPS